MTDTELPKIGAPATRALASIGVTRLEQVAVGMLPRSRASASALTKQCLIDCCTSRFGRFGRLHDMEHHSARTPTVDQLPGIDVSGVKIVGADPMQLAALRRRRLDHGGNAVEAFVDRDGGWPLRVQWADRHWPSRAIPDAPPDRPTLRPRPSHRIRPHRRRRARRIAPRRARQCAGAAVG